MLAVWISIFSGIVGIWWAHRAAGNGLLQPVAVPPTGVVTQSDPGGVARINLVSNENNLHSLIQVTRLDGSEEPLTIFIRAGEGCMIRLPGGKYRIDAWFGDTWYGPQKRFGNDDKDPAFSRELELMTPEIVPLAIRRNR
jgi:hypothetical protein